MKRFVLLISLVITTLSAWSQDFREAAQKSVHSVVYIQCLAHQQSSYYDDFFNNDFFNDFFGGFGFQPRQRTYKTSGSGVIISSDGYIVTNNHVVADADSICITLNDKREYIARVIGNDAYTDLAVLKIEANDLIPLNYGNSDDIELGEWVLAVGNPFNLTSTVTAGIVSAKARNLEILNGKNNSNTLTSFIQTDAAMNPGNSGGALVNTKGELIGINAAIASSTGSYTGYSFAIPVNIAKKVINDLIKYGETQRVSVGMTIRDVDSKVVVEKNLKDTRGTYVENVVKNACADKAGIKAGDVLLKINNREVNTISEVNEILSQLSPMDKIECEIIRNGQYLNKTLTLMSTKELAELEDFAIGETVQAHGATLRELTDEEKAQYSVNKGLVVTKTERGALMNVGIRKGFVITSIDGNSNLSIKNAKSFANKKGQTQIEGFYPNSNRAYSYITVL